MAQIAGETPPPERALIDENGVNVATGRYRQEHVDLALGSGAGALEFRRQYGETAYTTAFISSAYVPPVGLRFSVSVGSRSFGFVRTNSGFTSANGDGAQLTSSGDVFYLTESDGTRYIFGTIYVQDEDNNYNRQSYLSEIRSANGNTLNIHWDIAEFRVCRDYYGCEADATYQNGRIERVIRLGSLSNAAGYAATLNYAGNHVFSQGDVTAWQTLTGVSGSNQHNGNGPIPYASISRNFQYAAGGYQQTDDVTDATGRTTRRTKMVSSNGSYEAVRLPGSTSDDVTVHQDGNQRVTYVQRAGGAAWFYQYAEPSAGVSTLLVTDPTGRTKRYVSDLSIGLPTRIEDGTGAATTYAYDGSGRLQSSTSPGGQVTSYSYDGRGNVATTTVTAAGGGTTLSRSASYDPNCSGGIICDDPTSTTDQRGVVTSYTYDPTHGGVSSVTVQNPGGTSPSTQIRYGQVAGVWLPVRSWSCATQASCENTGDAVQTSVAYDANLNPTTVTQGAGDGSLAATTTTSWSAAGDAIAVDGALPGGGDVSRMAYDAARRPVAAMAPDPDGGGPRGIAASRTNYDAMGRVSVTERGTVPSGASDWGGFQQSDRVETGYDGTGRKSVETLVAGGAAIARTQFTFDPAGRPSCVMVRMDPGVWNGQTADCGSQLYGPHGRDRVTYYEYDPAGRQSAVHTGYATDDVSVERTSYTATGQVSAVTDANGNVTSASYDGFDRPLRTTYPDGSYEEVGYAGNGDLTSRRLRDGQSIGYGHDWAGRVSAVTRPGGVYWQVNHGYAFDLLGRPVQATDSYGRSLTFAYDALSRRTSQGDNWYGQGNASYAYDLAGRRTRTTWSDGFFATWEYDQAGQLTAVRENGGFVLASYGYDDLGRRTSVSRGNGTVTSYGWDAASRLQSLGQDLAGGAHDLSVTFAYNPAGQIASRTSSNDAYAFTAHVAVDRPYQVNALNQYTSAGGTGFGYDGRGNLTQSGSNSYGYTVDNQLVTSPGANLAYDSLGRLFNVNGSGANTTLLYDGADVIAEINNDNHALLRRYVHAGGTDEPLVSYGPEGRRWLHADERGSVIALSDDGGNTAAINRYDEFGIPQSGNQGRFQYTGQKWLPELGLYDYKARMYSPTLGRFMQTDPVGYADGLNWYNYVGGDPINSTDPSGLAAMTECQIQRLVADIIASIGGTADVVVCGGGGGGGGFSPPVWLPSPSTPSPGFTPDGGGGTPGAEPSPQEEPEIIVTAERQPRMQQVSRGPFGKLKDIFCAVMLLCSMDGSGNWDPQDPAQRPPRKETERPIPKATPTPRTPRPRPPRIPGIPPIFITPEQEYWLRCQTNPRACQIAARK